MSPYLNLVVSFVFLGGASWCIGEGGEILGDKYDASIIGGLFIAWLNTAPEAIFFITALESNNPRFAVGAMSGSTIVVCTVAMGACYYFGTTARKQQYFILQHGVKKQCLQLLISAFVPITMSIFGWSYVFSLIGVGSYLIFLITEFTKTKELHPHQHKDVETVEESSSGVEEPLWKGIVYLLVGGGLILLFSEPFIEAVVDIAAIASVNPILLAFFLAPIASEMPEILESISLSRKGHSQSINVAVSNLIGGTITKTTLLTGIFSYYGKSREFTWENPNYSLSLVLLSVSAVISAFLGYQLPAQHTWQAYILFLVFIITGIIQYTYNSTFEVITPELDRLPTPT
uniref:Sodium/calcium exchanger membrane region domain-containing protein n=1 Tax=Arcella intermedia TaxID=1963864 RepID=A0A6B2L8P2_9EUKA